MREKVYVRIGKNYVIFEYVDSGRAIALNTTEVDIKGVERNG